jgi:hypothetical protein
VIVASLLLGLFSIWQTPREEEPQIVLPMLDVFASMPGATAGDSRGCRFIFDEPAWRRGGNRAFFYGSGGSLYYPSERGGS